MSAQAGPSSSAAAAGAAQAISPEILLFARGVLALLDLWPALNIAVSEQWGGPDSAAKKTWMGSVLVDEFESRATYLPATATAAAAGGGASEGRRVDPKTANDPPLDHDDLGDLLNQIMSDEFDANIEDGSIELITNDIIRLWRDILSPPISSTAEELVAALQRKAASVQKSGSGISNATKGAGPEVGSDDEDDLDGSDWDDDEEDGMDVDGEQAPQLVPVAPKEKERVEPVVDEDGFELVQKGGRKSGR